MVKNQGKKLTFDECKELAAQQGALVFGLTNTEVVNNVYRSTCLLPSMEDVTGGGGMAKHSTVHKNPRMAGLTNVGATNLSISVRDGNIGVTPIYKLVPIAAVNVSPSKYYNKTSRSPAFMQVAMWTGSGSNSGRADIDTLSKYGSEEIVLGGGGSRHICGCCTSKSSRSSIFCCNVRLEGIRHSKRCELEPEKRNSTIYGSRYGNIGK